MASLVPNLLSHFLNPALMASRLNQQQQNPSSQQDNNTSTSTTASSLPINPHHQLHHQLMHQHHHQHNTNANNNSLRPGGATATTPGGATRLQFIVPGEQVDLYGIINSVFSDVLDPRRQANMQHANNFHFQVPPM